MKIKKEVSAFNLAIGQRLRFFRLSQGMSQSEVARAIGISFQQLQKYERGTNRLSVENMIKIARHMGISPVEFIITESDEDNIFATGASPPHPDGLQLLQHYASITDPEKKKAVVKIAQWLS